MNPEFLRRVEEFLGYPISLTLDGEFHTDKTQRKIWYIGRQEADNGTIIYSLTIGDFTTFEKVTIEYPEGLTKRASGFGTLRRLSESTQAQLELLRNKNRQEVDREFNSASSTGYTEYMKRKAWPESLGLLGCRVREGHTLLVPMSNGSGELQGIQTIYHSGDKQFNLGAKKDGSFHQIGTLEPGKVVYVVEGLVTGVSVYEATNECVFVAFDAGNLLEVSRYIRRKCPSARIVVAGDNDPPKNLAQNSPNTGLLAAKKAADQSGGTFIVPLFNRDSPDEAKLSDWNDLLVLKGKEEVSLQLLAVKKDGIAFVDALGFRGQDYYYTSSSNPQITCMGDHSETDLLKIQPIDFWRSNYGTVGRGGIITVNWSEVRSSLMQSCRERGYFSHRKVRGLGVWRHGEDTVVHLGDRLLVGKKEQPLSYFGKECIYEYSERIDLFSSRSATDGDMEFLKECVELLNAENRTQIICMFGWMVSSQLCGALRWRPHVYMAGQAGSGKSSTIENLIKPLLSGYKLLQTKGASTEAGVRQTLGSHALPVIFDEFESDTEKSARRLEGVLELFRQSSTEGAGNILKGSSAGEAIEYNARFSGMVAAISPKITREADMSRFTAIELIKSAQDKDKYNRLKLIFERINDEFATQFFLRNVELLPKYIENIHRFEKALQKVRSPRFSEQHAPLLAGFCMMFDSRVLSDSECELMVKDLKFVEELNSPDILLEVADSSTDHIRCLQHLLDSKVRVSDSEGAPQEWTVQGLLFAGLKYESVMSDKAVWKRHPKLEMLRQIGVLPSVSESGLLGIKIYYSHPQLSKIFSDTPYSGQHITYLRRISGTLTTTIRESGGFRKCLFVPLKIEKDFFQEPEKLEEAPF